MARSEALASAMQAVRSQITGRQRRRVLIGIAGPPAAGKSTLATALAKAIQAQGLGSAVAVGMDGFHLANTELARLGLTECKGAPQTFDAAGFVSLLRRLRDPEPGIVYAPRYSRVVHESIGAAVAVPQEIDIVVVEGNYLLLDEGPWQHVRDLLDLRIYLDAPGQVRQEALVRRQLSRGLDPAAAQAWVTGSDEVNARLIAGTVSYADVVLRR